MDSPIRILCVFAILNRGGAESMCMNLYRKIDRTKIQFDFVKHTTDKCDFEDEIISLGGKIYVAPRYVEINRVTYKNWWRRHFENHPEHKIIHGHYFEISDVYFRIAHEYNRKTIAHSHNAVQLKAGDRKTFFDLIKNSIKQIHYKHIEENADLCLACSDLAGKWLFNDYTVFRNAIEINKFIFNEVLRKQIREKLGIQDKFVVGIVARITQQKNPYGVIDIFSGIRKNNKNAVLLWIGPSDESIENKVRSYAKEKEVIDSIIFTGSVSDAYKYYQAMDVLILPSFYEGLPVTLIESQTSGLPTFASNRITDEVCVTDLCHMISIDDISAWVNAITNVTQIQRISPITDIINSGYDIKQTASALTDIYLSMQK